MIEWGHTAAEWVGTVSGTTVPVLLYLWANKRSAKADTERRHKENQEKMNELVEKAKWLPHHRHKEDPGETLTADGIEYDPKDGS